MADIAGPRLSTASVIDPLVGAGGPQATHPETWRLRATEAPLTAAATSRGTNGNVPAASGNTRRSSSRPFARLPRSPRLRLCNFFHGRSLLGCGVDTGVFEATRGSGSARRYCRERTDRIPSDFASKAIFAGGSRRRLRGASCGASSLKC